MSLDAAHRAITAIPALGLGYVVAAGDGLACIDIDRCRDAQTGVLDERAAAIVERFGGAPWEASPSGAGVHIWVRVAAAFAANRKATWDGAHSLEIASTGKYFTVLDPGVVVRALALPVGAHSESVARLIADYFTKPEVKPLPLNVVVTCAMDDAPARIQQHAAAARLWAGDWAGYKSQSEADFALIGALGEIVGWNFFNTITLFRRSGLGQRKKAQREDYVQRTWDAVLRKGFKFKWDAVDSEIHPEIEAQIAGFGNFALSIDFTTLLHCRRDALSTAKKVAGHIAKRMREAGVIEGAGISLRDFQESLHIGSATTVRRAIQRLDDAGVVKVTRISQFDEIGVQLPSFSFSLTTVKKCMVDTVERGGSWGRLLGDVREEVFARGRSKSSKENALPSLGNSTPFLLHLVENGVGSLASILAHVGGTMRGLRKLISRLHGLGLLVWQGGIVTPVEDWRAVLKEIAPNLTTYRIGEERLLKRLEGSIRHAVNIFGYVKVTARHAFQERLDGLRERANALREALGFVVRHEPAAENAATIDPPAPVEAVATIATVAPATVAPLSPRDRLLAAIAEKRKEHGIDLPIPNYAWTGERKNGQHNDMGNCDRRTTWSVGDIFSGLSAASAGSG